MTRGVSFRQWAEEEIQKIHQAGLFKNERVILSPQRSDVQTSEGAAVNFCANNYLGLGNHPEILEAAREGLETHGYGMASVRFICGTQDLHKQLEEKISDFLGTDDTILYSSCFEANGGLFETILGAADCVISDELNHASIIDGIRLSKAQRKIYRHADMAHLEEQLQASWDCRFRLIASDGVFSMQGDLAPLPEMVRLAEKHDALIMIDECHATGLLGASGRGTPEHFDLHGRMDIITGTLGKALGGASGGFTSGRQEIIDLLRQGSRPYLFSKYYCSSPGCRIDQGPRVAGKGPLTAPQAAGKHPLFPLSNDGERLPDSGGNPSDRPHPDWRRKNNWGNGRRPEPARNLRSGVQLSGRSQGAGANPGSGVSRSLWGAA